MTLPQARRALLPDGAYANADGHLTIGGCDTVSLVERFGTPLYVYDEATIRARARAYRDGLAATYPGPTLACYAAKAYCAPWIIRLVAEEGLGLDVVSGGELYTALRAGFPPERIYFHGNNKAPREIEEALSAGVGRLVADNLEEIERIGRLAAARGGRQAILLRVTPGVDAHTHDHIKTGITDTKFGFSLTTGAAEEAVRAALTWPAIDLVGFHAHIGSQIFDLEPYRESIRRLFAFAARMRQTHGVDPRELSPGGGFGMRYTNADDPIAPGELATMLGSAVAQEAVAAGFAGHLPSITIEPGRSIVGPAGVALYRVGSVKTVEDVRTYVAVDGGMADNIRPTAYGAVYSALLANRASDEPDARVAIAGKYCESGDVLIRDAALPLPRVGDLLTIPGSGAYHLAMASNYNHALKPAVVVVRDGSARLVTRRQSYADLLASEIGFEAS